MTDTTTTDMNKVEELANVLYGIEAQSTTFTHTIEFHRNVATKLIEAYPVLGEDFGTETQVGGGHGWWENYVVASPAEAERFIREHTSKTHAPMFDRWRERPVGEWIEHHG